MKVRVLVLGRVQGVGFRYWTRKQAQKLGLECWVKNLDDGRVEAVLKGDEEIINKMLEKVKKGPPLARVKGVDILK